jgi:hypothetical protein
MMAGVGENTASLDQGPLVVKLYSQAGTGTIEANAAWAGR